MRTLDSDKKEIEKFTMLRYLKLSVCTFVYHSLGEPWATLRKTQVGDK